jgi:uncharacterized protein YkwD
MERTARSGRESGRRQRSATVARALTALAALAALLGPAAARADPAAVVNAIRTEGCGKQPPIGARVKRDAGLDDVAREWSRGEALRKAVERVGYPATASSSFHVTGTRDDAAIRKILAERYCAELNGPQFSELGAFQNGTDTWIVLATRRAPPPALDADAAAIRVLDLVNAARAQARRCGRDDYAAAEPLTLDAALGRAAAEHASDMARRGELTHRGSDGSTSGERITRAGYAWRAAGENVAAGQRDADAVVAAWLASPGHCATLMGPYFTQMGVAFALAPSQNPEIYWAQEFAAPR